MSAAPYVPVTPEQHDDTCRRGLDPTSQHYGLDLERCTRCRNLWTRLDEVSAQRQLREKSGAVA